MSNDKNTIHVTVADGHGTKENPLVVHMLEGDAPDPVNPIKLVIDGDINAVKQFIKTRGNIIDKSKAIILFEESKLMVALVCDENNALGTTVTAKLEHYPELVAFGINANRVFSQIELEKLIRMNRMWFPDKDEHVKLFDSINKFKAQVQSQIEATQDQRGNKANAYSKQVTTGLALNFKLQIPIFKGQESRNFLVEICFDTTEGSVRFWLESMELYVMEKATLLSVFNEQKESFEADGWTVISK